MLGDGLVPSNAKAGYLARMLARRVLRMRDELPLMPLAELATHHSMSTWGATQQTNSRRAAHHSRLGGGALCRNAAKRNQRHSDNSNPGRRTPLKFPTISVHNERFPWIGSGYGHHAGTKCRMGFGLCARVSRRKWLNDMLAWPKKRKNFQ